MRPLTFLIAFVLTAIINLTSIAFNIDMIRMATKPLLMIFLGLYFFTATRGHTSNFKTFTLIAIVFSWLGDVFLLFDSTNYFISGIGGFLIAQLGYTYAFNKFPNFKYGLLLKQPWWAIPLLVYGFSLNALLWENLGVFKIPVITYSIVITIMAISALHLNRRIPKHIFISLFTGVALFLLSDSCIAINKFGSSQLSIPYGGFIVMLTYIAAQYLIITNAVKMVKLFRT